MRNACAWAVVAIAGFLTGCGPKGGSQPPEPEPTAVTDPSAPEATPAPETADPEPEPETTSDSEPAETVASTAPEAADPPPEPTPETTETDPEPAPAETKPAVATLELPRALHGKVDSTCGRDAGVGQKLKSFSLPSLTEGKTITAGTFRGRVQVVNFWGTWCKPCLKELPEFDQLYRRYRKHGMTLLAIATDEDRETVEATIEKKKLGAKIAIAGEDYAGQYGSPKFPFTFVVDYKGVIRGSYRGYKPECMGKLEADIREQLQVRADAKARRKKKSG